MAKIVGIRISDEMYAALRAHARARKLTPSAAARDLVRRGLGVSAHRSLSAEAQIAAQNEIRKAIFGVGKGRAR